MTTRLGFSRDAMDRCQNHHKAGIGSVYDRHDYADEARRVQEAVGKRLLELATRAVEDNVVQFRA